MKNTYRGRKGQYASDVARMEWWIGLAVMLSVLLWHMHDANKPLMQEYKATAQMYTETLMKHQALEDQAILASNTINQPWKYQKKFPIVATAYTCDPSMTPEQKAMNCPNGHTATRTIPKEGKTLACGPSLLGKVIHVIGLGKRKCEDRGGAIHDGRIDIYLDNLQQAQKFGVRSMEYTLVE